MSKYWAGTYKQKLLRTSVGTRLRRLAHPTKLHYVDRGGGAGRQRARVDFEDAVAQPHRIGREHLGERRRRAAVLEPVLKAVPRAGDAAVDDAALAERPVLMGAQIGERADQRAVAEHGDALTARRGDDARGLVGDCVRRTYRNPAALTRLAAAVAPPLAPAGDEVQAGDPHEGAADEQREDRAAVLLHGAERDMQHDDP